MKASTTSRMLLASAFLPLFASYLAAEPEASIEGDWWCDRPAYRFSLGANGNMASFAADDEAEKPGTWSFKMDELTLEFRDAAMPQVWKVSMEGNALTLTSGSGGVRKFTRESLTARSKRYSDLFLKSIRLYQSFLEEPDQEARQSAYVESKDLHVSLMNLGESLFGKSRTGRQAAAEQVFKERALEIPEEQQRDFSRRREHGECNEAMLELGFAIQKTGVGGKYPKSLEAVPGESSSEPLKKCCPLTGGTHPYGYVVPEDGDTPDDDRILLYDSVPHRTGERWVLTLNMDTCLLDDDEFQKALSASTLKGILPHFEEASVSRTEAQGRITLKVRFRAAGLKSVMKNGKSMVRGRSDLTLYLVPDPSEPEKQENFSGGVTSFECEECPGGPWIETSVSIDSARRDRIGKVFMQMEDVVRGVHVKAWGPSEEDR